MVELGSVVPIEHRKLGFVHVRHAIVEAVSGFVSDALIRYAGQVEAIALVAETQRIVRRRLFAELVSKERSEREVVRSFAIAALAVGRKVDVETRIGRALVLELGRQVLFDERRDADVAALHAVGVVLVERRQLLVGRSGERPRGGGHGETPSSNAWWSGEIQAAFFLGSTAGPRRGRSLGRRLVWVGGIL